MNLLLEAVQKHYGLKPKELLGRSKVRTIVLARQLGMYLTRKLTPLSLEQIGLRFGGRDHTTVLYAQQRIERVLNENPQVQTDLHLIQSRLKASRSLPEALDHSME